MSRNPSDLRRIVVSLAVLVASPLYVLCGLRHVCMAGHMQHPPYSVTDLMIDAIWMIAFLVSGALCWKSNLHFQRTIFLFLLLLFLSRLLLGSGGGGLFLVELPLLLVLFVLGIRNLFGRAKDWGEAPLAERKAHRKKVLRHWAIAMAVIVGTGLLGWSGTKLYWVVRRAFTPTVRVSQVPFSRDFVLKPGDAYTFELPNSKTFAVWCRTNPWFVAATFEKDIGFEYGERAFERLDREEIQLPGGAITGGNYLSYIRQGPVYDGGMGNPSEYILYVEQYRISLKEKEINKHNIPMTVSVALATEKDR